MCCHKTGLSWFCECIYVDGTASKQTGVYSAGVVHLYADYRRFNDDGMLLPHFWPVKRFNGLSMTRDLCCIVGFVCTENKECLEVFKGQTSKMASSKCSIGSIS